jgi:hypothetical protein
MALGVTLAPYGKIPGAWPYGILRNYGGGPINVQPEDPQYYHTGEAGYYYDTALGAPRASWWQKWQLRRSYAKLSKDAAQRGIFFGLGAIPTDAEMSWTAGRDYPIPGAETMRTPVESGWIAANGGFQPGPWLPPDGRRFDGGIDRATGLGDGEPAPGTTADDVLAALQAHNDRVFALTIVSTVAVAVSAMITVFRTVKLIREDK